MANKKILLVEDCETSMFVEEVVNKGLYQLVTAKDGHEAFSKALEEQPDLILLDIFKPGTNGLDTCRKLKECDTTRTIPIIMVTTKGEGDNVEAAHRHGCSDYVTKPIDGSELRSILRLYLHQ